MATVLDLNDIALRIDAGDQQIWSPGYALLQKDREPVLGEIALHQSRLAPARTANRFWRDLSLNPVGISHPQVRHQADLVWHHLRQINEDIQLNKALVLTPSHYDDAQLSLLSGVLKSLDMRPVALVKRALAAATVYPEAEVYIELQLHQVLVTRIERQQGELIARNTKALGGGGYLEMIDLLLKVIQQRFIQETRFDPLHHANTEQQLVDSLPDILQHLARAETTLALVQARGEEHRAEIHRDELALALKAQWERLLDALPKEANLAVDETLLQFPGNQLMPGTYLGVSGEQLAETARTISIPQEADPDTPVFLAHAALPATQPAVLNRSPANTSAATARQLSSSHAAQPSGHTRKQANQATHLLAQGTALRQPEFWLAAGDSGRLQIYSSKPDDPLAICRAVPQGLELEPLSELLLNGELLRGKQLLLATDYCSSPDLPGGATAVRVMGDGD